MQWNSCFHKVAWATVGPAMHSDLCLCHPCITAMLIFSVSSLHNCIWDLHMLGSGVTEMSHPTLVADCFKLSPHFHAFGSLPSHLYEKLIMVPGFKDFHGLSHSGTFGSPGVTCQFPCLMQWLLTTCRYAIACKLTISSIALVHWAACSQFPFASACSLLWFNDSIALFKRNWFALLNATILS